MDYQFCDNDNKSGGKPEFNINKVGNILVKCDRRSDVTCKHHLVIPDNDNLETPLGPLKVKLPNKFLSCETANLVYLIVCNKCDSKLHMHYVGETGQQIRDRVYGHRTRSAVLFTHFNETGHTLEHLKVIILHRLKKNADSLYRKGIEYFYLRTLKPKLNVDFAPP